MASDALFRSLAPRIMLDLMAEFALTRDDAAAILGNGGHESTGFQSLQEKKPMVPGSAGGWGWFQWTGPRRRAFEAWAKAKKLDPASYEANFGFLVLELKGDEKAAIPALKKAKGLEMKVIAFEKAFERAGVKHYPLRLIWAQRALDAYEKANDAKVVPKGGEIYPVAPLPTPVALPTAAPKPDTELFAAPASEKTLWERIVAFFKGA